MPDAANDFDQVDFFTDETLLENPYPYFAHLRGQCPVQRERHHGSLVVTGYDEAVDVYRRHEVFSSANSVIGAPLGLPFEPAGDDVGALIERYRDQFPMYEHLVTFDAPQHTAHRALLRRLLTPKRLKENEEFMWRLADRQLDEFLERGRFEVMSEYAKPFALLVIADLLGVPEEDHQTFRTRLGAQRPGSIEADDALTGNALEFLDERFGSFIEDRRREPRDDVLTALATATFPDGSVPEVIDVVRIATFLFAAGQDTTARLLSSALRIIAERPDLQQTLRDDRERIPQFVEETLRLESPVKCDSRLTRSSTTVAGVDVPAGTAITIFPGALNRDPRRFDHPDEFRLDRENVRDHLAFGRGVHTCPGAPLARVEARVSIERFLDRMADIRISDAEHGPAGDRRFAYEPTYILRGLSALHLEYTPVP